MTELTQEEHDYYVERLVQATRIYEDALGGTVTRKDERRLLIAAVFERIASPLYFLRQEQTIDTRELIRETQNMALNGSVIKVDRVTEHMTGGSAKPEITRFKQSKAPDAEGYTEFARENYVKRDLIGVLQQLRVQPVAQIEHTDGYVYKLSVYNDKDYLWRKRSP